MPAGWHRAGDDRAPGHRDRLCPTCRGVWLDRGELDRIIERAASPAPQPRVEARRRDKHCEEWRDDDNRRASRDDDRYRGKPYKKRESFLSDIFDF